MPTWPWCNRCIVVAMGEISCRRAVVERSNGLCEKCGQQRGAEAHHRKNRSQGGKWEISNILLLCRDCHLWVTINPEAAHKSGWAVKSHENTEKVAVLIIGQWMYLKDNSTVEWADPPKG